MTKSFPINAVKISGLKGFLRQEWYAVQWYAIEWYAVHSILSLYLQRGVLSASRGKLEEPASQMKLLNRK